MMDLLAQTPNIDGVPADFVKYFFMCLAFAMTLYGGMRWGKRQTGGKDEPLHVHQPLEVRKHKEYAPKEETDTEFKRLRQQMESMARENLRQHQAADKKHQDLLNAGSKRGEEIMTALHQMETRIVKTTLDELKDIHKRINPIESKLGEHEGKIKSLTTAVAEIREWITRFFTPKAKP